MIFIIAQAVGTIMAGKEKAAVCLTDFRADDIDTAEVSRRRMAQVSFPAVMTSEFSWLVIPTWAKVHFSTG